MTEFKAAEKLLILNRHGSGLLARLFRTLQVPEILDLRCPSTFCVCSNCWGNEEGGRFCPVAPRTNLALSSTQSADRGGSSFL
jgi:hypothetical protein